MSNWPIIASRNQQLVCIFLRLFSILKKKSKAKQQKKKKRKRKKLREAAPSNRPIGDRLKIIKETSIFLFLFFVFRSHMFRVKTGKGLSSYRLVSKQNGASVRLLVRIALEEINVDEATRTIGGDICWLVMVKGVGRGNKISNNNVRNKKMFINNLRVSYDRQ